MVILGAPFSPIAAQLCCRQLLEKLWSDGAMNDGADFDLIGLLGVEDQMRLKAETAVAAGQFAHSLTDAREVRKKAKVRINPA